LAHQLLRSLAGILACALGAPALAQGPTVDVWYGDVQPFGQLGNPQAWANVLGSVSDPHGVGSLAYTLNGGASRGLSIGPDFRRLAEPGDFNVDIAIADLIEGANVVEITAVDGLGNATVHQVVVDYEVGTVWPPTFTADWSAVREIREAAQITDGKWYLTPDGIRTDVVDYDRGFAIGDLSWANFEVTVPITVHALDLRAFDPSVRPYSGAPGLGITARWPGHSELTPGEQPLAYWHPNGAGAWYDFGYNEKWLGGASGLDQRQAWAMPLGVRHLWKMRCELLPTGETFYGLKIWEDGTPEPPVWDLSGTEGLADLQNGSVLFVAHHVDATFGDVEIVPLADDETPPVISGLSATPADVSARIRWTTDEPTRSLVEYGLTTGYELGSASDPRLTTSHVQVLAGLAPETTYHCRVTATDAAGNSTQSADLQFTTWALGEDPSGIVSDDFSSGTIDPALWTFVDPLGDSAATPTGRRVEITPGVTATHDVWIGSNTVPYLRQAANDTAFEVEAKFESPLTASFQSQGILIEQDPAHVVRVEFHRAGSETRVYVATIFGSSVSQKASLPIPYGVPAYLRVARWGDPLPDHWAVEYSFDGSSWATAAAFDQPMVVTGVGVFAGNSAGVVHTATIDYFFNAASPIVPEDGEAILDVTVVGTGAVLKTPDLPTYDDGAIVELTAIPASGWAFTGWSGDTSGSASPTTVEVSGATAVTATFELDSTPPVISGATVSPYETTARVSWTTDEAATSVVDFGLTSGYGGTVSDPVLRTSHSVLLAGLEADTLYHFRVTSADGAGNSSSTADATFLTAAPPRILSDDFHADTLDTSLWTFVDPLGDSSVSPTGRELQIHVPAGPTHDAWVGTNTLARVMQAAPDQDFEVEAKFDSGLALDIQSQGIFVEQTPYDFLRIELLRYLGETRVFVARVFGSSYATHNGPSVASTAPMYLRVGRVQDHWTVEYSADGETWAAAVSFDQPMTVAAVGVYAGNAGPAHTATVDYFFDTAAPIDPEDGEVALTVDVVGGGAVVKDPDQQGYEVGAQVELTAIPDPGWHFESWSGDASGSSNPIEVTITADAQVTATFAADADISPPVISDVAVAPDDYGALVTWTTDEPATSVVDYGLTSAYGSSESDATLTMAHSVALSDLDADTLYHFRVTSVDAAGNPASSADATFRTPGPPTIVSDDFNATALDTSIWNVVDPVGDADVSLTGAHLSISVPATGVARDAWTTSNTLTRVMQEAPDDDFEVEAKFESPLTQSFQSQGIWVEQGPIDGLRFEFHHYNGVPRVFVASLIGGVATIRASAPIAHTLPMHLRVGRALDVWTVSYSADGSSWVTATTFAQPMFVAAVGVYAGNSAFTPHTAIVDYFFDTANPIDPEDDELGLDVSVVGDGTVARNPDQTTYAEGQLVELTAIAGPGWHFVQWTGDATGTVNPTTVTIRATTSIGATFAADGDLTPPVVSGIALSVDHLSALVTWTTDEPATSVVDYGLGASFGDTVRDLGLKTSHSLFIQGLDPETTYQYRITSTDGAGNSTSTATAAFTTGAEPAIASDDFHASTLDTALWTFVDPLGDAGYSMTGTQLEIVVPATGTPHDAWTSSNTVPRVMQPAPEGDFEVEAKFESALTEGFQSQGILVEQSPLNVLRIEFHSNGGAHKVFVASLFGGSASIRLFRAISAGMETYLKVGRAGDVWTVSYSYDGTTWTSGTTFTQVMVPTRVGVYAGNSGATAHTAIVDYFFNTESPIVPEDGSDAELFVQTVGSGTVVKDPDLPSYPTGTEVELEAFPDAGWYFVDWSGDVTGNDNPVTVTVAGTTSVTATFAAIGDTTPPVISNVQVVPTETTAAVTWITDEPGTSAVDYGLTAAYGDSVSDSAFRTIHSLQLTGLDPDTDYHFRITSVDAAGNPGSALDLTFRTADRPRIVSDDFSAGTLDPTVWTFVDPLGDSTIAMTGTQVEIHVPASGTAHDVWGSSNTVPRLTQTAPNEDFEVEVKFDSDLTTSFQSQGVLIEQAPLQLIRVEFHNYNGHMRLFAASVSGASASMHGSQVVSVSAPMYLRVARSGNVWTVSYSDDGVTWNAPFRFARPITVSSLSVHAGNSGGTPHTAVVDYFFDTDSPIVPGD